MEAQKRQSVQLSQASVRMRELEREVEASRDVYQSSLKRSRETEEQESINTVNARISGEATVPQRRTFPPAMSLIAMIGFVFGGLAAAAWIVTADRLLPGPGATDTQPNAPQPEMRSVSLPKAPAANPPRPQPAMAPARPQKPFIAQLRESDVMRTLGGILRTGDVPDATRLGWPTLRTGAPATDFIRAMPGMRTALAGRSADGVPVMAVIGSGPATGRSIAALNIALSAAREGVRVLMIDADHDARALSGRVGGFGKAEPSRLGWLSIGSKASRAIKTANGISILPAINGSAARSADAIRKAIAQARAAGGYDLVILDGPAMPVGEPGRKLIEVADGLVAILPTDFDINDCLEDVLDNLGRAERKVIGVILDELNPTFVTRERGKQYA
jgi:Mrp family chromosome partitioning ATPase